MEFKNNKQNGLRTNDEYEGKQTRKKLLVSVFLCLLLALSFVWWSATMWQDFMDLENNTKDITLHSIPYLLYEIGGKYLAMAFPVSCILFFAYFGFKAFKRIIDKEYEK